MGRIKKYKNEEELVLARRKWSKVYYEKNKARIDKGQKEKYHNKKNEQKDNLSM